MAFRKRTFPKRKYASSKAPLARKVRTLAKKVNNLPKPELKYIDNKRTSPASVGYDIAVVTDALCTPAVGDTRVTRDGSQLTMQSLHVRGRFTASTGQTEPAICRLMLVQAKQRYSPSPVTAIGTVSNLLEDANTNDAVHSMYGFTNRIHFRVLKDFKVTVQNTSTSGITSYQKYFQFTYKFKKFNKVLSFDAETVTAQRNQVYLVAISTSGSSNYPTIEYSARTTYYDN